MPNGKPVRVLGISADYHDSAAALVVDGKIVAAAQEERFTRVKGDSSFPVRAIDYCMRESGLHPDDLDAVVFYENPFAKFDRILTSQNLGRPGAIRTFMTASMNWLPDKLWVANRVRDILGRKVRLLYCDHHLSHAASAFYPSPFEDAAVVTVDGVGEWSTTTIGKGSGATLELSEHIEFPNSLGLLYSAFTSYCGFKINGGEYKLMGLAPYGTDRYSGMIRESMIHLADDGSFALNPELFSYLDGLETYNRRFEKLLGQPTRKASDQLTRFHADVAASIQTVLNEAVGNLIKRAIDTTGLCDVVVAGGVAHNIVSIADVEARGVARNIWVQPAAGDAGGALGAALWASHVHYGVPRVGWAADAGQNDGMRGCYLGPDPELEGEARKDLEEYGLVFETLQDKDLAENIAQAVRAGKVVAVAKGRMEFGPRALGARSVLADARDPEMQKRLNLKTKFREGFRPFAPVVLEERAGEFFDMRGQISPFMLKTYPVREHLRKKSEGLSGSDFLGAVSQQRSSLPAVTHIDFSARVQTVDGSRNPFLHSVLQAFERRTGCPVLINTSFNVRGEPIVRNSIDAIECFLQTDIDVLVLGQHIIRKADQKPEALKPRRGSAFRLD